MNYIIYSIFIVCIQTLFLHSSQIPEQSQDRWIHIQQKTLRGEIVLLDCILADTSIKRKTVDMEYSGNYYTNDFNQIVFVPYGFYSLQKSHNNSSKIITQYDYTALLTGGFVRVKNGHYRYIPNFNQPEFQQKPNVAVHISNTQKNQETLNLWPFITKKENIIQKKTR